MYGRWKTSTLEVSDKLHGTLYPRHLLEKRPTQHPWFSLENMAKKEISAPNVNHIPIITFTD